MKGELAVKINAISGVLFVTVLAVTLAGCSPSAPPVGKAEEGGVTGNESEAEPVVKQLVDSQDAPAEAPVSKPVSRKEPVAEPEVEAAGEPAPEPEPEPEPSMVTVPEGTELVVMFLDGVSSAASIPGDTFRARVTQDVFQDSIPVIPAGSVITGTVLEAVSLKKIGGKARLALEFKRLELTSGRTVLIDASFAGEGKSETKKDAATIGGATAGGALLGRIVGKGDKKKGALIGAIVGAAAGTAVAAKTEGEEVELPTGTEIVLVLNSPATVVVHP